LGKEAAVQGGEKRRRRRRRWEKVGTKKVD